MKNQRTIPDLQGRPFNGNYYPKIKRIRTEPRQRIRTLLRSIVSINLPEQPYQQPEQNPGKDEPTRQ
ncbi:hypothetical protein SNE26_09045 [Mucilaginibacter sp. cycad4]|uniref:hypothetical protein n=1 Tax=Mucilaginibacter sp. cycad4 TaxID=3342096 RepID=UPI002AAC48E9|nr:hypothetical protein [Mucilaginibacter gossypii]WPV01918.1 hypothetical protein SNE26_09045 [Mucilaginibacter gossypii]